MSGLKNIYILMGASGSGKTTIQNILADTYGLKPLISYTTRAPRTENENCHLFVSKSAFDALNDMAAYVEYSGNEYCATHEQIENSDLYVLDPRGLKSFRSLYHGSKGYKVMYVCSPRGTRVRRMFDRGDNDDQVRKRIETDDKEFFNVVSNADAMFVNLEGDDLYSIAEQIWDYIERCEVCNV